MSPSPDPEAFEPRRRSAWLAPAGVFLLALFVTALLTASVTSSVAERDRAAFEAEATRTADAVRERLDTTVTLLYGVAGLFAAHGDVDPGQFTKYVEHLQLRERYPGIQGMGFSARLSPHALAAIVAEMRASGMPDFHVWPDDPRPEYHSILYLEPMDERNRAALGFDMFTEPVRREAMARARDEGRAAASGRVVLVQEIDDGKQNGLLIYLPVYRGRMVPPDVATRRERLEGFVYAPLRLGDLLRGVRGTGVRELDFEIYDGDQPKPDALMHATRAPDSPPPRLVTTRVVDAAGRSWLLRMGSRPAFESLSQWRLLPWLAALSLAASTLLAWITLVQARARRDAEAAALLRRRNELDLQASEEQARVRAQELEQLYGQLRESDRRKDEFLAVLAHELRNPLAPIRHSLEILDRSPPENLARRAREIAARQVRHMVRLIDDLLDVSRISRGKIALQRRVLPVAEVVESALESSRPLMEARGHHLHATVPGPALRIDADPTRVAQILTNLLNNAAHYTPEGGQISLEVAADAGEVRITVRDNGIGIEPERLAHVFELFVQVDRPSTGGGLGIGLSLASRLARMHGGRIEARSDGLGRGSEFVLILPLVPA